LVTTTLFQKPSLVLAKVLLYLKGLIAIVFEALNPIQVQKWGFASKKTPAPEPDWVYLGR
ncbi:MAG: hypothetical protein DCF21_18495, partial [Leptolyngbya sp.]